MKTNETAIGSYIQHVCHMPSASPLIVCEKVSKALDESTDYFYFY